LFSGEGSLKDAQSSKHICVLKQPKQGSLLDKALDIYEQFLAACAHTQQLDLILGAETCLPCALNKEESLSALFDNVGAGRSPLVFLGAYRSEGKALFNTVYCIDRGRIIFHYDKRFPLPFLETYYKNPLLVRKNKSLQGLFFPQEKLPYTAGKEVKALSLYVSGTRYQAHFAVCADFFCVRQKEPVGRNPLLIVLANDTWFHGKSIATSMFRYAVLWAVCHQIPVLYVSCQKAAWIERTGCIQNLMPVDS
jgi:apolipoprotein N-acyltransferase